MLPFFLQVWSWILVAASIYVFGEISKAIAAKYGWRSKAGATARERTWYDITLPAHPIVAGMLLGLLPWPTLHAIEETGGWREVLARVGWFTLSGMFCGQMYETIEHLIGGLDDIVLDSLRSRFKASKHDDDDQGGEA